MQNTIAFTPKYRRKIIYSGLRKDIQGIIKDLCKRKEIEIIEGDMMPGHIHLPVSVPPPYSVPQIVVYLKGKSAMMVFGRHANLKYRFEFLGGEVLRKRARNQYSNCSKIHTRTRKARPGRR